MPVVEIAKFFSANSRSARDLFVEAGAAFYIPAYQREYKWKKENVKQLMDDLIQGVNSLLDIPVSHDDVHRRSTRFFGTVILVNETSPWGSIRPRQNEGMPTKVKKIIDGQQRLSTFSVIAVLLHASISKHLKTIEGKNSKIVPDVYIKLKESASAYLEELFDIFSSDFRKGTPRRKPIIIRGASDQWVYDGDIDQNYQSDLANYLAKYIDNLSRGELNSAYSGSNQHLKETISILEDEISLIEKAYNDKGGFPDAVEILEKANQEDLWGRERLDLVEEVRSHAVLEKLNKPQQSIWSLVQLFMFTHYFLHRSCFTTIELSDENLAFDIFQSLNSTGTPLTSIETFKPQVMNLTDDLDGGYEKSAIKLHFQKVSDLFDGNEGKNKDGLTNNYLIIFALVWEGKRLGNPFSEQRKFLLDNFSKLDNEIGRNERIRFTNVMGGIAEFWSITQVSANFKKLTLFDELTEAQLDLLKLCISYLKDAGHRMSNSVLARYYIEVKAKDKISQLAFLESLLAVTAFFTLWRSARQNAGLDAVYRRILKEKISIARVALGQIPDIAVLKTSLVSELKLAQIGERETWISEAVKNFDYVKTLKSVIRFSLLSIFNGTTVNSIEPGHLSVSAPGFSSYLTYQNWSGGPLDTIEHIAPQTKTDEWSIDLYVDRRFDKIGNLTLLPTALNASAGNRGWKGKWYYYAFVANGSMDERQKLVTDALADKVELSKDTLEKLRNSTFHQHMQPLALMGKDAIWNGEIVDRRSLELCSILWDQMIDWLS